MKTYCLEVSGDFACFTRPRDEGRAGQLRRDNTFGCAGSI